MASHALTHLGHMPAGLTIDAVAMKRGRGKLVPLAVPSTDCACVAHGASRCPKRVLLNLGATTAGGTQLTGRWTANQRRTGEAGLVRPRRRGTRGSRGAKAP